MSNNTSRKSELLGTPTKLPLKVAVSVAYRSIKVRLTRSLVTVSSVVLAVTFLLVVLGGEISSNAVFKQWSVDSQPGQDASRLRTLLIQPRPTLELLDSLQHNAQAAAAFAADFDLTIEVPSTETIAQAVLLSDWIATLKPSQRYLLIRNNSIGEWLVQFDAQTSATEGSEPQKPASQSSGNNEEQDIYAHLPPAVREIVSTSATFTGTRLPFTPEELISLGTNMPQLAEALDKLATAENSRLQRVIDLGGAEKLVQAYTQGQTDGLYLQQLILGADEVREQRLRAQFEIDALRSDVIGVLSKPRKSSNEDGSVNTASSPIGLKALINGELENHPFATEISAELSELVGAESLAIVKDDIARRQTLDGLRTKFTDMGYDPESGQERTLWLVLLSLLVCIVGIVNSMMMAVTERFREIATMKCLGAMDGFILKTFMIESGSVGFVGAVLGALIGIILVLIQSTARYGGSFWSSLPVQYLFLAAVASLACGLILTILGALLPAYKAARMHPIEAMRLEA